MKSIAKRLGFTLLAIGIIIISVIYSNDIYRFYIKYLDFSRRNITITNINYQSKAYTRKYKLTSDFIAKDKSHLLSIYYTVINSGNSSFTFYCDIDYKSCINDLETLSNNDEELSIINNLVNPYNSFSSIATEYTNYGKITITINKTYNNEKISKLENKIDEIIDKEIKSDMTTKEKIKVIHDYIINNTSYDETEKNNDKDIHHSSTAYGVIFDNLGTCSGYSDAMAIFLNKLNIANYKISNDDHIWNYVKLENNWYHLDVTWDDPVTSNGAKLLKYYYFLIDEEELNKLNTKEHDYDRSIYQPK